MIPPPAHQLTLLFLPEQARKGSPGPRAGFFLCAIPCAEALPRKAAVSRFAPKNLTKPNIDPCLSGSDNQTTSHMRWQGAVGAAMYIDQL